MSLKALQDMMVNMSARALDTQLAAELMARVSDARESARGAQSAVMAALDLPTASELQRLLAHVRSLGQRFEDIEDLLDRVASQLGALSTAPARLTEIERRFQELDQPPAPTRAAGAVT